MRAGKRWAAGALTLAGLAGVLAWTVVGQEQTPSSAASSLPGAVPEKGAGPSAAGAQISVPAAEPRTPPGEKGRPELTRLSLFQRQVYLSAQRGVAWLKRANQVDGRFRPGVIPALRRPLEGDHYLRQAGAALALARAASFFHDEQAAALARQALLTLLLDTQSTGQPPRRYTVFPPQQVSRLAAAGLLAAAIYHLPAPGEDLLAQAEELCTYLRQQQQADGSLLEEERPQASATEEASSACAAGWALYGVLCGQRLRPAPWKLEMARKALGYYASAWKEHKELAATGPLAAAFTEAGLLTRDPACTRLVWEINDWLCTLQYEGVGPQQVSWQGGFKSWAAGQVLLTPPTITSAVCGEALAQGLHLARATGDLSHYQSYQQALERCLEFLLTLQYTEANTQHFAEWYRPEILGGFYASLQDGTLRLDYTQHAVCALMDYLAWGVESP